MDFPSAFVEKAAASVEEVEARGEAKWIQWKQKLFMQKMHN